MELVLQIVSGETGQIGNGGSERRKSFGRVGGRIGRASDCEWVLPSPYISRYHATVSHAGNTFYIESTGENGIALNDPAQMLPRFDRHELKDGDRLFIDEMEIVVTLARAGMAADASPAIPELQASQGGPLDPTPDDLDPLKRLLADTGPLADTAERAIPWNNSSSLADHFVPPRREQVASPAASTAIAEDWDDESFEQSIGEPPAMGAITPIPAASVPSRPAAGAATSAPWAATQAAPAPPPAAANQSRIAAAPSDANQSRAASVASSAPSDVLRAMLQGLIDERQARAQMAAELRLRNLPPPASNPNPLRHAVNADDALRLLAPSPEAGRMTGAQAVTDALDEIRAHQLATTAGIQAAFQSMLSCFEPQALEARFDRRLKHAGVLPIGSKFRYWQLYVELFEETTSGADSGFQKLFGDAFADAYAETYSSQLTALKGRARQPAHGT